MQIKVISLHEPTSLLKAAKRLFPSAEVTRQAGVNVKSASVDNLYHSGLITRTTGHTLRHGRKWHHEIGSKGAVGLAHAVRLALEEDTTRPLLLLEDDCTFTDKVALQRDVASLLQHMDEFDMAVFGAKKIHVEDVEVDSLPTSWKRLVRGNFHYLHCVLYSPRGRARVAAHLRTQPLDMQLDALYSSLASFGELDVLLHSHGAKQSVHFSSIQEVTGTCLLCYVPPNAIILWAALATGLYMVCRSRRCRGLPMRGHRLS